MGPPTKLKATKAPAGAPAAQLVPSAAALREAEASNVDGNSAFKEGHDAEAIAYYGAAVVLSAGSVAKYYGNRAQARLRTGSLEEARDDAAAAVRLEPGSLKFNFRHAKALTQLGQLQEATRVLDRVIAADASVKDNPDVAALRAAIASGGASAGHTSSARGAAAQPVAPPSRPPATSVASLQDPSATTESLFGGQNLHPVFAVSAPGPLDLDTFWVGRPRVQAYTWLVDVYRVRTYNANVNVADDDRWLAVRLGRADTQTVEADFLAFVDSVRRRLPRGLPSWWSPLQLVRVARMADVPTSLECIEARSHMCIDSVACWPLQSDEYVELRGTNSFCPVAAMRHVIVNLGGGRATMHQFAPTLYTGATVYSPADDAVASLHRRSFEMHARCPEAEYSDEEEELDDAEFWGEEEEEEEEEGSWETEEADEGASPDGVFLRNRPFIEHDDDDDDDDETDATATSAPRPPPSAAQPSPVAVMHAGPHVTLAEDDDDDDDMPPPLEDITGDTA